MALWPSKARFGRCGDSSSRLPARRRPMSPSGRCTSATVHASSPPATVRGSARPWPRPKKSPPARSAARSATPRPKREAVKVPACRGAVRCRQGPRTANSFLTRRSWQGSPIASPPCANGPAPARKGSPAGGQGARQLTGIGTRIDVTATVLTATRSASTARMLTVSPTTHR